ncbi:MAG TPA: DNA polymerase III subunit gamma/tau, partial [Alphaproteobacteria bacterium]|nr:DNA polymerase III subunit gamma/tau [Alphaproteobacteria bacterium]
PANFRDLVALATRHRAIKLKTALMQDMHLVHFEPGRIEFRPADTASPKLAAELGEALKNWTGTRWIVSVGNAAGAPTLAEQEAEAAASRRDAALRDPLVQQVLETFPGAEILAVRDQPAPAGHKDPLTPISSRGETE